MKKLILLVLVGAMAGVVFYSYQRGDFVGLQSSVSKESSKGVALKQVEFYSPVEIKQGMSVAEAYKAIPHRRIQFLPDRSHLDSEDKLFLNEFFQLTDLAMVERVRLLNHFRKGNKEESFSNYHEILRRLYELEKPEKSKDYFPLVFNSIERQMRYFKEWQKKSTNKINIQHKLIQKSHKDLYAAYMHLMSVYSQENADNKNGFFDHLCALDFI